MTQRPKAKRQDLSERVITAAMSLSADQGWRKTTLADIAKATKVSPEDIYPLFSSKIAILNALNRQIDMQVLSDGAPTGDNIRDDLFEMLMRRFEALSPYREGVKAALRDTVGVDPLATLCGCRALHRSMAWTLETSGVNASGLIGRLGVRALSIAFSSVLRVWLNDEGADLGKTMAALDRALQRLERAAQMLPGRKTVSDGAATA